MHFQAPISSTSHMLSSTVMGGFLPNSSAAQVSSQDLKDPDLFQLWGIKKLVVGGLGPGALDT